MRNWIFILLFLYSHFLNGTEDFNLPNFKTAPKKKFLSSLIKDNDLKLPFKKFRRPKGSKLDIRKLGLKEFLKQTYENFSKRHGFKYQSAQCQNCCCGPTGPKGPPGDSATLAILSAYTTTLRGYSSEGFIQFDKVSGFFDPYQVIEFTNGGDLFTLHRNGDYLIRFIGVAQATEVSVAISPNFSADVPEMTYFSQDLTHAARLSIPTEAIIKVTDAPRTIQIKISSPDVLEILCGSTITIQQLSQL